MKGKDFHLKWPCASNCEYLLSEEKFRSLIENLDDIIIRYDCNCKRIYVNPAFEKINNISSHLVLGKTPDEISTNLTPVKKDFIVQLKNVLQTGAPVKFDLKVENENYWFVQIIPEFDANKMVISALSIWSDISFRKRAEKEVTLLNHALNNSTDAAYLIDEDHRFIYVNDTACSELGYSRQELLNMKVTDIDPEPPTAAIKKIMNDTYKTGNNTVESWHQRQDGSKFPVEISGSYITYENKNLAFTLARNISERKQFERQLILLNHALDQSKDAVYLMANQGQFIYVNDTACTMLGYDRQELLKMKVTDIDPDLHDFQIEGLKRKVIESGTFKFEARHRKKNRIIFPVEISTSIIHFEDKLISFALVCDITERKNKEVLLHHQVQQIRSFSSKLIKAREIERRLIAHELHDEFGQILTGIKFSLEDIKHKTSDKAQDKIDHIQKEIGQLINQIRNLSISLRPPLLDDLGLLTALKWHIERYSNSTGVLVDFLHHGIEHLIISDDNALVIFRIIQESLTNIARHANSQRAKVHLIYNENEILINICDDGKGFDLEYEMAHAKNIGIIGMRERLEDVGGVFSIKSKHGVGTEITAKIPINIK